MNATSPRAVVLLSGGLDSTTTLAIAKNLGFDLYALSFRYGQRHAVEIHAAGAVAKRIGVAEHRICDLDPRDFQGSALTSDIPVPKNRSGAEISVGIPPTYVPLRNLTFLTRAVQWAEVLGARDVFIGVNILDASGYPDCRSEFIRSFEHTANLGSKAGAEGRGFTIHAPLIELTKAQIIERGLALGVDYGMTSSCYDPSASGEACGLCDTCQLRLKGFREAGVTDPRAYQATATA